MHVISTDEKTGIQAKERALPTLPMRPGQVGPRSLITNTSVLDDSNTAVSEFDSIRSSTNEQGAFCDRMPKVNIGNKTMAKKMVAGERMVVPFQNDRFDPDDQEAMIKLLKPLLPSSPSHWFCLWLPLRQARYFEQGFHPLFPRYEGDKNIPPETIFLSAFEKHISAMIPTLRYLNSIRSVLQNEQGAFCDYAKVNLENGAERMIYDGKPFDMRALYGRVSLSGQNASSMVFGGHENFLKDRALGGLKRSKHWPRRSVTENGRSISKPEKADPHCAAVFTGRSAEEGAGKLEISWGIFLPLSDDETREIVSGGGDWSYTLLLHGIFFVDAGRFRIEFSDPAGEGFKDPDRTVRRRWNQMLRDRGTLKLLLPGLQCFVDKNKLSNERVVHLTHMLAQSKKVFATYRSTICQDHAWVRCVGKTNAWTLVPANKPIYVLPEVPRDERRRPFEVFGHLETLCSQHVFTYDGLPRLDRGTTWEWPIGILQQLLDCDAASAFKRQAYLDYLVQFVERLSESDQAGSPLDKIFFGGYRCATPQNCQDGALRSFYRCFCGQGFRTNPSIRNMALIWSKSAYQRLLWLWPACHLHRKWLSKTGTC